MIIPDNVIETAKLEIINEKRAVWARKQHMYKLEHNGPYQYKVPDIDSAPPVDSFHIDWLVIRWPTGFAVIDTDEFAKLPKRTQNKLLKLGGLK